MYTPVVPLSGYSGWQFIQKTYDRQFEAFTTTAQMERELDYFRENIAEATDVGDLVTNRRLLTIALGAYGLEDDVDKPAFVRKILEEGTLQTDSFANRLNNREYKEMIKVFSYGNGGFLPTEQRIEQVIDQYRTRAFEKAVGEVDNDMRLALNFQREIGEIANADISEKAGWFRILGSLPLREVVDAAFGLPSEFAQLDLDRQAEILADKASVLFDGSSVKVFQDTDNVEKLIRRFQVRRQAEAGPSPLTPGYGALTLLQSANGLGAYGSFNLALSNSL